MKWVDNFKVHQVDKDQRRVHLTYLDISTTEEPNWLKEGEAQMSELSIKPQTLQVQLEKRRVRAQLTKDQVEYFKHVGIHLVGHTKSALTNEWDLNLTIEIFEKVLDTARTLTSTQEFTGFKAWFYSKIGYKPLIWLESNEFLDLILKGSNEIARSSRLGPGDWIIVSPKTAIRFTRLPDFIYSFEGRIADLNEQVHLFGSWRHLKIWTSHLVGDDQVLMGRRSTSSSDVLVSAVVGEAEWLQAETVLALQRSSKVFSVPGSEMSYLKWKFEQSKPSFWKWLRKKLIKY